MSGWLMTLAGLLAAAGPAETDVDRGRELYESRCRPCHAVRPGLNRIGPSLSGVVGRAAAAAPGFYGYVGLAGAEFAWTLDRLDRWLANPEAFLRTIGRPPKTPMTIRVKKEPDRRAIIAYLETLQ